MEKKCRETVLRLCGFVGQRPVRGGQGVDEDRVFKVPPVPEDAGCDAAGGRDSYPEEGREGGGDAAGYDAEMVYEGVSDSDRLIDEWSEI